MAAPSALPLEGPPVDVAIIGCGVAGLGAAYTASRHPRVRVTLYESRDVLGGHANTVMVSCPRRRGRARLG